MFTAEAAPIAKREYTEAWDVDAFAFPRPTGAVSVRCVAATGKQLLSRDAEIAEAFPEGWRDVAPHLLPNVTTCAFQWLDSEGNVVGGGAGLVKLADEWALFPSPHVVALPHITRAAKRPNRRIADAAFPIDIDAIRHPRESDLRDLILGDRLYHDIARPSVSRGVKIWQEAQRDAVRLVPKMAPLLFRTVDEIADRLGVVEAIDVYAYASWKIGAWVGTPLEGRVPFAISAGALERLDAPELQFLVGHELGHTAGNALEIDRGAVNQAAGRRGAATLIANIFAWARYTEITADRSGLLCCGDLEVAIRTLFKVATGLTASSFVDHASAMATQLFTIREEGWELETVDAVATHPINPLRIAALQAFATRSERIAMPKALRIHDLPTTDRLVVGFLDPPHSLAGEALPSRHKPSGQNPRHKEEELSAARERTLRRDAKARKKADRLASEERTKREEARKRAEAEAKEASERAEAKAEQEHQGAVASHKQAAEQAFLAVWCWYLMRADGGTTGAEEHVYETVVDDAHARRVKGLSTLERVDELHASADNARKRLSEVERVKLLESLVILAMADTQVADAEKRLLNRAARLLGLKAAIVSRLLNEATRPLD